MVSEIELLGLSEIYERDGVVLLRGFLNVEQIQLVENSLTFAVENPGPMATDLSSEQESNFFFDFLTFRRNPFMRKIYEDPELLKHLSYIVGTNEIRLFHDTVLIKTGNAAPSPWHQDRPHYLVEGEKNFSVWISPNEVGENESLAFIPGSHKCGNIFHPRSFRDDSEITGNDEFVTLTKKIFDELSSQGIKVFSFRPGDAIIFDNRVLHSALRSREPASRSAISLRYVGDKAKLTVNFVDPTPALHLMGMKLIDGGALPDAWFPLVYSRK